MKHRIEQSKIKELDELENKNIEIIINSKDTI